MSDTFTGIHGEAGVKRTKVIFFLKIPKWNEIIT